MLLTIGADLENSRFDFSDTENLADLFFILWSKTPETLIGGYVKVSSCVAPATWLGSSWV